MSIFIDNQFLMRTEQDGFLFSLEDRACSLIPPVGQEFGRMSGSDEYLATRKDIERAAIIGHFNPFEANDTDISHNCIVAKSGGSWDIGLPRSFAFALPSAISMAEDVLSIYGEEAFLKAQIQFMAQRSTVKPSLSAREHAKHWHTHENEGAVLDLTYILTDALPTEFRTAAGDIKTDNCALTRFGAREVHRATVNETDHEIRRTYGLFMIVPDPKPSRQTLIDNAAFKNKTPEGRAAAFAAAGEYMRMHGDDFTPLEQPRILEEHAPAIAAA